MPGSTEYSMAPVGLSGVSKTVAKTPTLAPNPITTAKLGDAYTNLPEVYKTQDFNEQDYRDKLLTTKYGTEASRRDKRKFNRYMKSEEGLAEMDQAKQAHTQAENQKWSQSLKARSQAMDQESTRRLEAMKAEWDSAVAQYDTRSAELEAQDLTARIAGQARFGDAFRLARQSGLETFTWRGKSYGTKYATEVGTSGSARRSATPAPAPAPAPKTESKPVTENPVVPETPVSTGTKSQTPTKVVTTKPAFDFTGFGKKHNLNTETINGKKYLRYDPDGIGDFYIGEDGKVHIAPTAGTVSAPLTTYKDTPMGGAQRQNAQTLFTMINDFNTGKTNNYERWYADYIATHPKPAFNASLAGSDAQTQWNKAFTAAKAAAGYKQGGRFNRVSYFQQGGAAQNNQADAFMQAVLQGDSEVIGQLVQAASQGDKQATQLIEVILKEDEKGNQQVTKAATVIKQLLNQTVAAKWGAKLGYLKSIKYAKGGKTCPACEKQVEMKACGGKKAKKRYFGGLI